MVEDTVRGDYFVYFSDGNTARIIRQKKVKAADGVAMIRFMLQPSPRIIRQYGLDREEDFDTETGYIVREYVAATVQWVDNTPGHMIAWVYSDFNGHETHESEREAGLIEQIKSLQRSNQSLKTQIVRTQQELQQLTNMSKKSLRGYVDMVNEARKGAKRDLGPPEDEYAEQQEA